MLLFKNPGRKLGNDEVRSYVRGREKNHAGFHSRKTLQTEGRGRGGAENSHETAGFKKAILVDLMEGGPPNPNPLQTLCRGGWCKALRGRRTYPTKNGTASGLLQENVLRNQGKRGADWKGGVLDRGTPVTLNVGEGYASLKRRWARREREGGRPFRTIFDDRLGGSEGPGSGAENRYD